MFKVLRSQPTNGIKVSYNAYRLHNTPISAFSKFTFTPRAFPASNGFITSARCFSDKSPESPTTPVANVVNEGLPPLPEVPPVVDIVTQAAQVPAEALEAWPTTQFFADVVTFVHNAGLPWWLAIILTSSTVRFCFLPLSAAAVRHAQNFKSAGQPFSELFRRLRNKTWAQRKEIFSEMRDLFKRKEANPFMGAISLLTQLPVLLTVAYGVRLLALTEPSLQTGGLGWFTDLRSPEEYHFLAILTCSFILLNSERAMLTLPDSLVKRTFLYIARGMAGFMFLISFNMPCAIMLHWLTSGFVTFINSILFRLRPVQRFFRLAPPQIKPNVTAPVSVEKLSDFGKPVARRRPKKEAAAEAEQ